MIKALFNACFDLGLSQTLTGRGLSALQAFSQWMARIVQQSEREPLLAVRDLLHEMDYEKLVI